MRLQGHQNRARPLEANESCKMAEGLAEALRVWRSSGERCPAGPSSLHRAVFLPPLWKPPWDGDSQGHGLNSSLGTKPSRKWKII